MDHSSPHPPQTLAGIAIQLSVVFALVLANGFFVAAEFALVSVRKTRIDQLAGEGNGSALVVQRAVHNLDRYIAATQVGITIASLLLGGLGEKALEPLLAPLFSWVNPRYLGLTQATVATGFAYFIMTALHVIIGELMPKSIALQNPERVSLLIGRPMTFCAKVFAPMIWLLNGTGNALLRLIGIQSSGGHGQVHSPEELDLLFKESHQGGELNATEAEILHRVVRFSDLTAREVMVPRVEMKGLPMEIGRDALDAYLRETPHTRTPVYHGSLDEIVGIAHLKDLVRFEAALPDSAQDGVAPTINLMPIVREAARVPESITIDKLLVEFKRRRQQMAIVIDEFGGTSGVLTMGDLLDQVFGDVHDEFDAPEPEIFVRPDHRVQMPGRALIDQINDSYNLGFCTDQADTVAGLVLEELGRPAVVGDEVEINGAHLRVEEIDRLRITSLSLQLPENRAEKSQNSEADPVVA